MKELAGTKITHTNCHYKWRKSPLEVKELGGNQEMPQVKELCVGVVGAIRDVFRWILGQMFCLFCFENLGLFWSKGFGSGCYC